jgi:hypothetical protein
MSSDLERLVETRTSVGEALTDDARLELHSLTRSSNSSGTRR